MGRDSSVGIATRYGMDGPGIESRWGRDFPHPSRPALGGPPSLLYNGYRVFPGGKAAGAWCWPPTYIWVSRSRKSRAIPLLTLWDFMACYGSTFTFYITLHWSSNKGVGPNATDQRLCGTGYKNFHLPSHKSWTFHLSSLSLFKFSFQWMTCRGADVHCFFSSCMTLGSANSSLHACSSNEFDRGKAPLSKLPSKFCATIVAVEKQ